MILAEPFGVEAPSRSAGRGSATPVSPSASQEGCFPRCLGLLLLAISYSLRSMSAASPDSNRTLRRVSHVGGDTECGPAGGVVRPEPRRALPHAEVADALAAVRGAADWIGAKLQFEFMVLTAARPGHARPARWAEIDVERRTWTLPAERTAFPFAHRVPLSSEALAVVREARDEPELQTARRRGGDLDLVFPSPRGRTLSLGALGRMLNRLRIDAVPSGFRTSFREWAAHAEVGHFIVQACLWPRQLNRIPVTFIRPEFFDHRVPVMERWGRHVAPDRGS